GYRVFQNMTGPDIVKKMLRDAGTTDARMSFRLSGSYAPRIVTTQYDETDWAFVERVCAEEGIAYWFDSDGDAPIVCFGDDPASHASIEGGPLVPFEDPSGLARPRAFFALEIASRVANESVFV